MTSRKLSFVNREGAHRFMAFRVHEWLDVSAMEPRFGVQAQVAKGKWCHIAYNGSPLIFVEKIDARDEVKRLQRAKSGASA